MISAITMVPLRLRGPSNQVIKLNFTAKILTMFGYRTAT